MTPEKSFLTALSNFARVNDTMKAEQQALLARRDDLIKELKRPQDTGFLKKQGELSTLGAEVNRQIEATVAGWSDKWQADEVVRQCSEDFADRVVLLIFGMVNAGKSSFCNFLAQRFESQGLQSTYFRLDENGKPCHDISSFKEGSTETTGTIQGVKIGEHLVLIDTPGLHSVTEKHGNLTKKYTDTADAVLWLSSSESPGKVQELESLEKELVPNRPLLCVITRSDNPIEDEDTGEPTGKFSPKSSQNRDLQQKDVYKRAKEYIEKITMPEDGKTITIPIRHPVSISVRYAKQQGGSTEGMSEAGFEQLFGELNRIATDALSYKKDKPLNLVRAYTKKVVVDDFNSKLRPLLQSLYEKTLETAKGLEGLEDSVSPAALSDILAELPALLDKHKSTRDTKALTADIGSHTRDIIDEHLRPKLTDYVDTVNKTMFKMAEVSDDGYEDVIVDVQVVKGSGYRAGVGAGGAAVGATFGAVIGSVVPIVGNVVGGVVGGIAGHFFGDKIGKNLVDTAMERQVVGVTYAGLQTQIEQSLRKSVPQQVAVTVEECRKSFATLAQRIKTTQETLTTHVQKIVQEPRR